MPETHGAGATQPEGKARRQGRRAGLGGLSLLAFGEGAKEFAGFVVETSLAILVHEAADSALGFFVFHGFDLVELSARGCDDTGSGVCDNRLNALGPIFAFG